MNDLVSVDLGFVHVDAKVVSVNSEVCSLEFAIPLTKAQPGDPRWMGEKSANLAA